MNTNTNQIALPATRSSGGTRLRLEDFRPLTLARMAKAQPALYNALRDERHFREAALGNVAAPTAPDAVIAKRLETMATGSTETASDFKRRLADWRKAIAAIERVSPPDSPPPSGYAA